MARSNISILSELKEKFLKVNYLLKEASKTDPENEPYKSKYEARDILNDMSDLIALNNQKEMDNHLLDLLAVVYCINSIISYDVEEISTGTELAKKARDMVSGPICPSRILCAMTSLNNLGFWASNQENYSSAQEYLEFSESLYNRYNLEVNVPAMEFEELFTGEKDPKNEENGYEKCHTQTLFYLAQVYAKNNNPSKAAKYCHVTLKRQFEAHEEDAVEWSLNTATLSQFLIEQNAFKVARHHLAASTKVIEKHNHKIDELLSNDSENEELKAKKETASHRLADIYRCWAKYSIFLLNGSKDRLLTSEGDKVDPPPQPPEILKGLEFTSLKEETKELEQSVTADFILTYEDAKPLFQKSQEWLNLAKEYYTLEDHASEHATIAQDSSKLYHLLSFFQSDESIQCKLHKRRIDTLSSVVNSLNATYYLKVCREIWFEIGETCMTMADIKASQARASKDPKNVQHCASKVKQLTLQGIKYLEDFIKSFKLKSKEEKYPEDFEKNIILGYMYLGHMYARLNEPDKNAMIGFQEESLRCYSAIIDYCTPRPDVKKAYPEEYSICVEMVDLIPLKISKMKAMFNKSQPK